MRPIPMAEPRNSHALSVRDLVVDFVQDTGAVRALEGVSLDLHAGRVLGVVGESGCGKSVTARSILRIVERPGRIVDGQILLRRDSGNGQAPEIDLTRLPADGREMRSIRGGEIALIFQEPMTALNPVFTVGAQLAEVPRVHQSISRRDAWARAVEMLGTVGIPDPAERAHSYPHQLSGGMRQRVMIGMALMLSPALLIADEPTTALDVTIQAQILALLDKLQSEIGMAVLFITHNLSVVAEIADRVVVMYSGRVVEEGDVRQLFKRPRHPYTRGLLECLPRRALDDESAMARRRLNAIPGQVASPLDPLPGCAFAPRCELVLPECSAAMPLLAELPLSQRSRCIRWEML